MSLTVAPPAVATAEALSEIVGLMERVVPRERPWAPDLEWQYLRNPSGMARYVNAYEHGRLIAHYAVVPMPPLAGYGGRLTGVYLSLNVAADPTATVPGLMVVTTRALYRSLLAEGPSLVVGVTNENSSQGFVRVLGFRSLGRLSLTLHPPGRWPRVSQPRALMDDPAHLVWRTSRPAVAAYCDRGCGALTVRLRHHGLPLDAVLSTGLSGTSIARVALPSPAWYTPRLYASFGGAAGGGLSVPHRLRPSPLEYVFRVFGDDSQTDAVQHFLATRRFEFLDFDVV